MNGKDRPEIIKNKDNIIFCSRFFQYLQDVKKIIEIGHNKTKYPKRVVINGAFSIATKDDKKPPILESKL